MPNQGISTSRSERKAVCSSRKWTVTTSLHLFSSSLLVTPSTCLWQSVQRRLKQGLDQLSATHSLILINIFLLFFFQMSQHFSCLKCSLINALQLDSWCCRLQLSFLFIIISAASQDAVMDGVLHPICSLFFLPPLPLDTTSTTNRSQRWRAACCAAPDCSVLSVNAWYS